MAHRFNADHRDRLPKQKQRVTNWPEYTESLRQRGDLTAWISEDALALWGTPSRTTRGGQPVYLDLAIETCLTVGMVLRQTEGLMRSIAALLGIDIAGADFSTLSRGGRGLGLSAQSVSRDTKPVQLPVQLVVDSTGLRISGEGQEAKPETRRKRRSRRSRRKLHPGPGLVSGAIVCSGLTTSDVGGPTVLPEMPDQIDGPVDLFSGDGAYDGEPTRDVIGGAILGHGSGVVMLSRAA